MGRGKGKPKKNRCLGKNECHQLKLQSKPEPMIWSGQDITLGTETSETSGHTTSPALAHTYEVLYWIKLLKMVSCKVFSQELQETAKSLTIAP